MTYNLPGSGTLNCNVLNTTWELYKFFNSYDHVQRLINTNQLGHLIDIFPGAHHSRYEYVFLQWTIISELCKLDSTILGLSRSRSWFGKTKKAKQEPSIAELLQTLALLLNIGHIKGTFASERALLQFIKSNSTVKSTFKRGLKSRERDYFEKILSENNFYSFHHLLAFYFINRCKGKSKKNVDFCTKLLRGFCYKDEEENFTKLNAWKLYKSIRRVSYLILDSHYAPVPFSLDSSSILLNFDALYEDIITEDSLYAVALSELEKILQKTVYLSANSSLTTSNYSQSYYELFKNLDDEDLEKHKITSLNRFLRDELIDVKQKELKGDKDWEDYSVLDLKFEIPEDETVGYFRDPFEKERYLSKRVGKSYSHVSLLPNPSKNFWTLAFSVIDKFDKKRQVQTGLKIANNSLKALEEVSNDIQNKYKEENFRNIAKYLLRCCLGWEKKILLEKESTPLNQFPYIYCRGVNSFNKQIDSYTKKIEPYIDDDSLCEIQVIKNTVNKIDHKGHYFVFLGSSKIFGKKEDLSNNTAEFDGLIFCPQNQETNFAYIVESKNTSNASTSASNQLTQRLDQELISELDYEITNVSKGAYANLEF